MRTLVAIPVFNEEKHLSRVLNRVLNYAGNVLVIDDGSTDATPTLLNQYPVDVIRHAVNRGYGRSLHNAFNWAVAEKYDWLITMDCDEQHEPEEIPRFLDEAERNGADIISGSRYLPESADGDPPPADRRAVNLTITQEINTRLGLDLTDSFCGFKAYRVRSLAKFRLDVDGYAFPMQLWVQAVANGLKIREVPVTRIYNDPSRTFGAVLDNPEVRLAHYRDILHRELRRCADRLPEVALDGVCTGCGADSARRR